MGALLITVLLPFLAQTDQINDKNVYEVVKLGDGSSYYAERTDKNENPRMYVLRPILLNGVGSATSVVRTEVELRPTTLKKVRDHLQADEDRRYRTVNGQRVSKEEFDLAERARAKALELEAKLRVPEPIAAEAVSDDPAASETPPPSPLMVWGPQIGLALGALVLIGIIVKLVILNE